MKKSSVAGIALVAYGAMLIKVMVFKDLPTIRVGRLMFNFGGTNTGPANLAPFKSILPYLLGEKGSLIAAVNLVGNVVLLIPVGLLSAHIWRNMAWKKALVLAVGAGLLLEGLQLLFRVGIFDVDDVILNGLGVLIGVWLCTVIANKKASPK